MAFDHTNSWTSSSKVEYQMVESVIDIKDVKQVKRSECNIYKVPCNLRNLNSDAYTPRLISIGPLHLDDKELKPMQEQKLMYFQSFWDRVNNRDAMERYKQFLAAEETAIRNSYAGEFQNISKTRFVDMLLLDSVFIMELFLRISELDAMKRSMQQSGSVKEKEARGPKDIKNDWILTQTWLMKGIQRDLLLLENQIPMYILDDLYNKTIVDGRFIDLAHDYFARYDPDERFSRSHHQTEQPNLLKDCCNKDSISGSSNKSSSRFQMDDKQPIHFTDLIRYFYLCKDLTMKESSSNNVLRTATKLQQAGVSFEKVTKRHLLDIKFEKHSWLSWFLCLGCIPKSTHFKARFRIPQLKVDNTTECVLRNLIAFEQCHYADMPYICNYVSLIDSLIHTKDDVELLVEKEVIVHELGSDKEVATLVNGLCKHVVTNSSCYEDTIEALNKHYQNVWNRTMAALRLVYFRDPWRSSSTLVGIAVLVFTIFNFCRVIRAFL